MSVTDTMKPVTVICERCEKIVEGLESDIGTAGFYRASGWAKYMDDDEQIVCDECMQSDPRYLADYPPALSPDVSEEA